MAKFCMNCGTPLPEENAPCPQCGFGAVQAAAPQPEPASVTEPAPQSAPPVEQPVEQPAPQPVEQPAPQPVEQPAAAPAPAQPAIPPMPVQPPMQPAYPMVGAPGPYAAPPKKSKKGLIIGIAAGVLAVALGVLAYFGFRDGGFLRGGDDTGTGTLTHSTRTTKNPNEITTTTTPTTSAVNGTTETHGYYEVLVPSGFTMNHEDVFGDNDPKYFSLQGDSSYFDYFMFNMMDQDMAQMSIDTTRDINDDTKDVSVIYNGVTWTGVAYNSYGIDCFSMYADFGGGNCVIVSGAGNAYDSDTVRQVLSSLRVNMSSAATTTKAATTTTTKAVVPASSVGIDQIVGYYTFSGSYTEYFGDTTVDEGEFDGVIEFAKNGSDLLATIRTDDTSGATITLSYDPDTMTATYSEESESLIENVLFTFYESDGKMCFMAVIQDDYPYSDIPSDTYYLEGERN